MGRDVTARSGRFDPPPEDDVLERLVKWASGRDDIRALILTSTRAVEGASVSIDLFSDYDVIAVVDEVRPFYDDRGWLSHFGDVLVLYRDPIRQRDAGESFAYITQYSDGLKIDFTLASTGVIDAIVARGKLPDDLDVGYRVLLDKDGLTIGLAPPSGRAFVPERPTETEFLTLVEEFFHEATYVAKHLWRDDLLPAKYNLDHAMKQVDLRRMLDWLLQTEFDWSVPTRAYGKGLKRKLAPETWEALERTYAGSGLDENWEALFATIELFRDAARKVGNGLGFAYPEDLDRRVCGYLREVRALGGAECTCDER
jgi:aminoglycoside 6-adenylyltransferase